MVQHAAAWCSCTLPRAVLVHTYSRTPRVVHATHSLRASIPRRYIGETARYVLASPPGAYDRAHKVKVAWGNGMRPEVRGLVGWYSEYSE